MKRTLRLLEWLGIRLFYIGIVGFLIYWVAMTQGVF